MSKGTFVAIGQQFLPPDRFNTKHNLNEISRWTDTNLMKIKVQYQPSGATTHRLQHFTACLIRNGRWGLGISQTLGFYPLSEQLSPNKFFDLINSSLRTSTIQNGHKGAPKRPKRFLGAPVNFRKISFLIRTLLL